MESKYKISMEKYFSVCPPYINFLVDSTIILFLFCDLLMLMIFFTEIFLFYT